MKKSAFCRLVLICLICSLVPLACRRSPRPGAFGGDPVIPDGTPTPQPQIMDALSKFISGTVPVWIDPRLPVALRDSLKLGDELKPVNTAEEAAVRLEIGSQAPVCYWVYALVAPFPTIRDDISSQDLLGAWRGEAGSALAGQTISLSPDTLNTLTALWGLPAPGVVNSLSESELLDYAWGHRPGWAIVPFDELNPRWKVIALDGLSPLQKAFTATGYPLSVPVTLSGDADVLKTSPITSDRFPSGNRDPNLMTTLAMTGTTALVRATAYAMEQHGITYPAADIGPWLREADLTHVSNEVPFADDCPYPNPVTESMTFCSSPRYIQLLEDIGTDIVELTGDHFGDWGAEAMNLTLDIYNQHNWLYYGGGANLEEGRRAVEVKDHGNCLVFIGCNSKGGNFATAGPDAPGAVPCDYDWIISEVGRLKGEGAIPIVSLQSTEYYTYAPQSDQQKDYRVLAEAGAAIVSGSQAHQPQAFDFDGQSLIHYGLGNLFFDQYDVSLATRQGMIDWHVFYNGKHISTGLLTFIFTDYAHPRPMTSDERNELLTALFDASGW